MSWMPARRRARISPRFLAVVAVAVVGGALAWTSDSERTAGLGVFAMVCGLWVVSVCIHEFGHAFVAHRNGDHGVAAAGYLTLDPVKYTNPVLSIVLPLIFIAAGGIGLPGGAVEINRGRIRSRFAQSMVSAAGPLMNLAFAVGTLAIIRQGSLTGGHAFFWLGLSFFALLQIAVLLLNLLPVPGLDGFGIIEPWLSWETRRSLQPVHQWGIFIAIGLLWVPAVNHVFFGVAYDLFELAGVSRFAASAGQALFQFWSLTA